MSDEQALVVQGGKLVISPDTKLFLSAVEQEVWRAHTRHSAYQIKHLMVRSREFPGNADKFHQFSLEVFVRYQNIVQHRHQVTLAALRIEGHRAWLRLAAWWRWLPFVDLAARRREAEIQHETDSLMFVCHDVKEYLREMRVLVEQRDTWRKEATDGGESLEWDDAENKRWEELARGAERAARVAAPPANGQEALDRMFGVKR